MVSFPTKNKIKHKILDMIIFNLSSANISLQCHIIQCTRIVKINTLKIGKNMKVKINLPFLKLMYFGQFISDSSELGLKI